jgi:hypothetical protein
MLEPDRAKFAADPFGYSALAWYKWGTARTIAGYPVDPKAFPTSADLKSPIFWLTQAHALSEAAAAVFNKQPNWEAIPLPVRSMCDSQYCAAGLMLVGYSLEICLKGMLILTKGVESYTNDERQFQHHKLDRLAKLVPGLSEKDKAILHVLTHFTEWAGRYPDPGSGRDAKVEEIYSLSEQYQIAGRDLFALAARVMKHTQMVVNENTSKDSGPDA